MKWTCLQVIIQCMAGESSLTISIMAIHLSRSISMRLMQGEVSVAQSSGGGWKKSSHKALSMNIESLLASFFQYSFEADLCD